LTVLLISAALFLLLSVVISFYTIRKLIRNLVSVNAVGSAIVASLRELMPTSGTAIVGTRAIGVRLPEKGQTLSFSSSLEQQELAYQDIPQPLYQAQHSQTNPLILQELDDEGFLESYLEFYSNEGDE